MAFRADLNTFPDFGAMTAVVSVAEVGIAWTRALLWRKRVMARLAVNKRRVIARDISDLVTSRRDSREKRVWGETREKETGERRQKKKNMFRGNPVSFIFARNHANSSRISKRRRLRPLREDSRTITTAPG